MEIKEKLEEIKAENKANTEYLIYESAVARLERANKRLWITNVIKDIILVIVVCGFLLYLNQYEYAAYDYTYTQDSNGLNIIGNENGVDYNVTETTSANKNEEKENR